MSLQRKKTVTCPKCSAKVSFDAWDSVNVTLDPEMKEKVLNLDVFKFSCPECKFESPVLRPLLYHDMDKAFQVYLIPNHKMGDKVVDTTDAMALEMMHKQSNRVVTTFNELIEKIKIYDDGLNDMAVEIVKLVMNSKLAEDNKEPANMLYSGKNDQSMFFIVLETQQQMGIKMNLYNEIMSKEKNVNMQFDDFVMINKDTIKNYLK